MNGQTRSMLLHACAEGGINGAWQVAQHSILTGDQQGIDEVIDFAHEFPEVLSDDYRKEILALYERNQIQADYLEQVRLVEQFLWQQKEEARIARLREREGFKVAPLTAQDYLDLEPHPEPS